MRKLAYFVFTTIIIGSIFLCLKAFSLSEWETLTASISLITAVISSWLAFEVFAKQNEADQPQLIVDFDLKSRQSVTLLTIKNHGTKPAFNIDLHWDKELLNHAGKVPRFGNPDQNQPAISVLNKDQRLAIYLDATVEFFQKNKGKDLTYSGHISYTESITSTRRKSVPFFISMDPYRGTLKPETDRQDTYDKLGKLPGKLDEVVEELAKIRTEMQSKE